MRFALALALFSVASSAAFGAQSPVADAAERRDMAGLQALLKQKADVNAPQGDGTTALHWAAFNDDLPAARLLLAAGAKAEAVTRVGSITPLLMASRNGSAGLAAALLNAGADVNRAGAEGTTPLMQAAASGSVETVKLLLDRGAAVDAKDHAHAQTPLMFAASLNRAAVVKLLLAHGADASLTTKLTKLEKMRVDIDGNPVPAEGEKPAAKAAEKPDPVKKQADAEKKPAVAANAPAAPPVPADPVATLTALVQRLAARIGELEKYPGALHAGEIVAVETNPAAAAGGRGGGAGGAPARSPRARPGALGRCGGHHGPLRGPPRRVSWGRRGSGGGGVRGVVCVAGVAGRGAGGEGGRAVDGSACSPIPAAGRGHPAPDMAPATGDVRAARPCPAHAGEGPPPLPVPGAARGAWRAACGCGGPGGDWP